jgi:nitrite reductase/ring-hydroxylating ferredoxin subunit
LRGLVVTVQERSIAVFRIGETVHAIGDSCPHAGSLLAPGRLDRCSQRALESFEFLLTASHGGMRTRLSPTVKPMSR